MNNLYRLQINPLPFYHFSSWRHFLSGERHITRTISEHVLLLMVDGVLCFSEDGIPLEVKAGEWYIQCAGLRQSGDTASRMPHYYYIHFEGNISAEDTKGAIPLQGKFCPENMIPLLNELESVTQQPGELDLAKNALFLQILSALCEQRFPTDENNLPMKVADLLAVQYKGQVHLDEIASQLGYTRDSIIRLFKNYYGITPYQYILSRRIDHAQKMLLSTECTINEIAFDSGFNSETALYRAFKKRTGSSPSQWRIYKQGLL